ncbi:MAG: prepilin-type N-terminal cleavage/methylation domain-containing protein [Patescibacteria group bacterium]
MFNRKSKGFTLFETIITIALLLAIAGSFGGFMVSLLSTRSSLESMQEVDENSRMALDIMSQKIRSATGVNTGASTFDADPGVLALSMADPAVNPTIFRLDQDNGILTMQEGAAQPIALTTNEVQLSQLLFSLLSGSTERENVRITIETQMRSQDDSYVSFTHTFQTAASVRQ